MMAFDEAKFRSAAKAAGYSDKEIDAELKGAVPAGAAPAPSMDDTFADKEKALREEYDKKVKQATTTEVSFGDNTFNIPTFFTSPAGIVTAVGAGIGLGTTLYGAGSVAPKVYQSIKDRWMTKTPEIDRTIDIPLEATPSPTPNVSPTPLQQTNLTPQEIQARADRLKAVNPAEMAPTASPLPPAPVAPAAPTPVAPTGANVPPQFAPGAVSPAGNIPPAPVPTYGQISTPLSAAPVDAPAPTPSAAPNSPVTSIVTDTVKELIQETPAQPIEAAKPPVAAPQPVAPPQDLVTGTGKPAFAGQGPEAALNKKGEPKFKPEYADINAVPKGFAFVPNAPYIDTLRQNIGQSEYTKAYSNRPFPLTNEQAIQESKDINKLLGRASRAENVAAGLPAAELTPGITKKTSAGTKPVRVAGTVGALMAVSDLAKAETPGQFGMAGANLLEAVLPPGFTMMGAGEGSSAVPSADSAMLLGSPYAQSDIARKRRQAIEYALKVGGGRGLTPASAYMR
jgi:hypothetical protein